MEGENTSLGSAVVKRVYKKKAKEVNSEDAKNVPKKRVKKECEPVAGPSTEQQPHRKPRAKKMTIKKCNKEEKEDDVGQQQAIGCFKYVDNKLLWASNIKFNGKRLVAIHTGLPIDPAALRSEFCPYYMAHFSRCDKGFLVVVLDVIETFSTMEHASFASVGV